MSVREQALGHSTDLDAKISRDRGRRSRLTNLYNELHTLCTRAIEEPSILAVCNKKEARALYQYFPNRMTRQRTLSNVIDIFGILRLVLTNLRNKNDALKKQQKQISRGNDGHAVDKSARASASKDLPQVPGKRVASETFKDNEDGAVARCICWIKLEGERR